jgi:hypothetical protein
MCNIYVPWEVLFKNEMCIMSVLVQLRYLCVGRIALCVTTATAFVCGPVALCVTTATAFVCGPVALCVTTATLFVCAPVALCVTTATAFMCGSGSSLCYYSYIICVWAG